MSEYDALPEIGHGCGHNLIAVLGVGAGLGIKAAMQVANQPIGKVRWFFKLGVCQKWYEKKVSW